jgi:hypothetical protein
MIFHRNLFRICSQYHPFNKSSFTIFVLTNFNSPAPQHTLHSQFKQQNTATMGIAHPGLAIGLTFAGIILFLPILVAMWTCRRDLLPSFCFRDKDKNYHVNQMFQNQRQQLQNRKGGKTLDLPPGHDTTTEHSNNNDEADGDGELDEVPM